MARPTFVQVRSAVLFVGGLVGAAYVTVVDQTERPTLLILFAAMMGLPLFLRTDEKNHPPAIPPAATPPEPPSPSPQVGAGNEPS
jgi:hypothetical protein